MCARSLAPGRRSRASATRWLLRSFAAVSAHAASSLRVRASCLSASVHRTRALCARASHSRHPGARLRPQRAIDSVPSRGRAEAQGGKRLLSGLAGRMGNRCSRPKQAI